MKKQFRLLIIVAISCLAGLIAYAQDSQKPPRWVSDNGYWVVESNIHSPKNQIVRFYTTDNVLIYQETVTGKALNVNRASVRIKLKKVLDQALTAWDRYHQSGEEKALVSAIL